MLLEARCRDDPRYVPRDPTRTALYGLVREQLATFRCATSEERGVPEFVAE